VTREIREQAVVITGASSGIGRATAMALGKRGASLVLAARSAPDLQRTAQDVSEVGGTVEVVVTDVSQRGDIDRLAQHAVERFGRIDTWVNNAAVGHYSTVEQTTVEEIERVIQVNLLGQIYGMKAALPILKRQSEGTIINVASIEAVRAMPYHCAYGASKHGIRGFSEVLRLELAREQSPVKVVVIEPASINTPFFTHSRSKLGVKPLPFPPSYAPEAVAEAIVFAARHPRPEIVVGGAGKMLTVLERLSPPLLDWLLLKGDLGFQAQQTEQPDDRRDNLDAPMVGTDTIHGEFADQTFRHSAYTRLFELHPFLRRSALAASLLGTLALVRRAGR
jgi:short-subunit dehydrogenase